MGPPWRCTWPCSGRPTGAMSMEESNGKAGSIPSELPNPRDKRTPMVLLTRKIEFAASHLYHNPNLSAEENRRIFGKCNNPHGHGHNYTLEVTVEGEPDPVTAMVLHLKELKDILERQIIQRINPHHLTS